MAARTGTEWVATADVVRRLGISRRRVLLYGERGWFPRRKMKKGDPRWNTGQWAYEYDLEACRWAMERHMPNTKGRYPDVGMVWVLAQGGFSLSRLAKALRWPRSSLQRKLKMLGFRWESRVVITAGPCRSCGRIRPAEKLQRSGHCDECI